MLFGSEELYRENIIAEAFNGLPQGVTLTFDYTSQGLTLNLDRTLKQFSDSRTRRTEVERVALNSLASDDSTRQYIDDIFSEINTMISE